MSNFKLIIAILLISLCSCQAPMYVVVSKRNAVPEVNTCVVDLKPINKRATRLNIPSALVGCDEYSVNDTLIITRNKFANF